MKIKFTTIISTLIFLTFLGFAGLENYLILFAFVIALFVGVTKYDVNRSVRILFIIFLLHVIIYCCNFSRPSMDWLAKNFLNPVILYFLGCWLTLRSKSSISPIKLLVYGFFLHGAANVLIYAINPSTMIERSMSNIWGGQLTATLQNLLFIPMISLLFYGVYILKDRKRKALIIAACLIAVYGSIVTASRTLLYLVLICFLINMIFMNNKNQHKKISIVASVLLLAVAMVVVYEVNLFGIRSWVESSNLCKRIATGISANDSLIDNKRWTINRKMLSELPSHPFGNIAVVHYAHNLFLDIAKYTGIIPAASLLLWSIAEVVKQLSYTLGDSSDEWDAIMFSMATGFMIAFFLEPVLDGLPIIFGAFCYLCGAMKGKRARIYESEMLCSGQ